MIYKIFKNSCYLLYGKKHEKDNLSIFEKLKFLLTT